MPQFAVYRSPGSDRAIPFLLQIQSSRLERSATRVLMALTRMSSESPRNETLSPHLVVQGELVWANPMNMVTLRAHQLGRVLEILSEPAQDRIIRAIDELISRA